MKRSRKAMFGLVAAAALLAPGCVVVDHHDAPGAGIEVVWDFEGYSCSRVNVDRTIVELWDHAGLVDEVHVTCPGNVAYFDVPPGTYDLHVYDDWSYYDAEARIDAYSGENAVELTLPYVGP